MSKSVDNFSCWHAATNILARANNMSVWVSLSHYRLLRLSSITSRCRQLTSPRYVLLDNWLLLLCFARDLRKAKFEIYLRAKIKIAISHSFLDGLPRHLVYRIAYIMSRCNQSFIA